MFVSGLLIGTYSQICGAFGIPFVKKGLFGWTRTLIVRSSEYGSGPRDGEDGTVPPLSVV